MKHIYEHALSNFYLFEDIIPLNEYNETLTLRAIKAIEDDDFIRNDFKRFIAARDKINRGGFITPYTEREMIDENFQTFQVRGFDIGFALHKLHDGNVDITSVFNNEDEVRNIGDYLLKAALRHGGTQLDHFEGKLSDIYGRNGFKEYDRYKWDDNYAPQNWNYEKYGKPDVVLRRHENFMKENIKRDFFRLFGKL